MKEPQIWITYGHWAENAHSAFFELLFCALVCKGKDMITNNQPLNAQLLIVSLKEMSLSASDSPWVAPTRVGAGPLDVVAVLVLFC